MECAVEEMAMAVTAAGIVAAEWEAFAVAPAMAGGTWVGASEAA